MQVRPFIRVPSRCPGAGASRARWCSAAASGACQGDSPKLYLDDGVPRGSTSIGRLEPWEPGLLQGPRADPRLHTTGQFRPGRVIATNNSGRVLASSAPKSHYASAAALVVAASESPQLPRPQAEGFQARRLLPPLEANERDVLDREAAPRAAFDRSPHGAQAACVVGVGDRLGNVALEGRAASTGSSFPRQI